MNNTYNRKALWSLFFGVATLLLPLTALNLKLLLSYGIWQFKYSTPDGSMLFAIQAIAALVLSIICLYLSSAGKKEIRTGGGRGIVLAHFAFIVGLLGLAYAAVSMLDSIFISDAFGVHTVSPQRIP